MKRRVFLTGLVVLLAACNNKGGGGEPGAAGSGTATASSGKMRIAVIPKGTTHEFWKSVHAGAVKAARELDVEVIWKGPLKEDDLKQQVDLVQSFTAQRVDGIVLAPLNDKALVKSVKDATRSKIPVVVIDSALQGDQHVSFVSTNNKKAGALAGEKMAELLDGKGKVVVLRYQEGSASTANREEGFVEAAKAKGLTVVSDNQYGGATTETSFAASESLLLAKRASKGGVDGIFCPNESTTFGMLLALQKLQLAGKIKFIGFDASDKLVQGLKDQHIAGLVLQDPFTMGYLGVQTMVSHLKGEKVAKQLDTGSTFVTSDNMIEPKIKKLLEPELGKWLGE
jgi:ribose transport system substrate-binding protein